MPLLSSFFVTKCIEKKKRYTIANTQCFLLSNTRQLRKFFLLSVLTQSLCSTYTAFSFLDLTLSFFQSRSLSCYTSLIFIMAILYMKDTYHTISLRITYRFCKRHIALYYGTSITAYTVFPCGVVFLAMNRIYNMEHSVSQFLEFDI